MNFSYLELSRLKMAAVKLLETASQIEAVNVTTSFNGDLIPTDYLDRLMDEIDASAETIAQITGIKADERVSSDNSGIVD
jgi:hypothetical protein